MILISTPMQEGVVILAIGMGIVFLSLLLLYLVFEYGIPNLIKHIIKQKEVRVSTETEKSKDNFQSGEEMAAICSAIYVFLEETHDDENAIITISQSPKVYSPWSSKIYVTHQVR